MAFIKRIALFLLVNFLVVITISVILSIFNIQPYLTQHGLDLKSLAIFCLIWGMGGAFISLGLSRIMAKWLMGVQVIDPNTKDPSAQKLLQTVYNLAKKAGLPAMPEVGLYDSPEINAFATGPTKSRALVAVSSGLISRMDQDEVEAVLGHEVTHIANGDMVTMTLIQGVINAFVMFLARVMAFVLSRALSRKDSESEPSPILFHVLTFVLEIVFMILGTLVVAAFSRYREFRADAGGARLAGREKMIAALQTLGRIHQAPDPSKDQPSLQAFKISSPLKFLKLFATHPPIEERIARLQELSLRS